ncbi:MAG: hypothetical protein RJA81_44 [Planctomycetota bacterium]|jgi:hypothetical protein
MVDDNTLESLIEKANNNWQMAIQGFPDDLNKSYTELWGFFSYGDASPAIGGGGGVFMWFPNRNSMLDFIRDTLPYSPPGLCGLDWDKVASNTKVITDNMKSGVINDIEGIERLNEVLKTFSQIEWLGTVAELLNGNHPYILHVRESFRMQNNENNAQRPIQSEEIDAFRTFLKEWGF